MGDGVNIAARLEGDRQARRDLSVRDAYRQVKGRLDLEVSDLGPTKLKNIADPIRVYSLNVGKPAKPKPRPAPAPENLPRRASRSLSCPSPISAGAGAGAFRRRGYGEPDDRPLKGTRRGRDRPQTAFTYKGKPLDVKTIGRELNVRYVLEGSVQRGGNRMRVNVQLIDAETGNHLWAERFDKPLADLFDMQDEIVARVAGALNTELVAAEARRAEQTPTPDLIDLYFQGMAWLNRGQTPDHVAQARSFFDRALAAADPGNVDALVGSARTDAVAGVNLLAAELHDGVRCGRSEVDQSLVVGPGPCPRPYVLGTCRHIHQARGGGYRRMRACVGAGSKSRQRPSDYWIW